jgi:hypothetical protein
VDWDSILSEVTSTASDVQTWFQDTTHELITEIDLFWHDFGGNYAYYNYLMDQWIDDTIEKLDQATAAARSAVYGAIDGFLDTVNPIDYFWSIPDIGPVDGYENQYTVGQVAGTVLGIGAQIAVGVESGGATLNQTSVNRWWVAPFDLKYSTDERLTAAEAYAKEHRRGVWSVDERITPWD